MPDWLEWVAGLPQYRHGWTLFGALAVLPALVSGNMLVHLAGLGRRAPWRPVAGNLLVLLACVALMANALWRLLRG